MASPLRTSCGILRGPPRVVGVTCLVLQQHRVCVCARARVRLCSYRRIVYGMVARAFHITRAVEVQC